MISAIAIALSLSVLANALPSPEASPVEARASCTTVYPSIARVDAAQPVTSYLPGFKVSQDAGGANKNDMFAEFSIPAGSWGCTLLYEVPAAYPVDSSGQSQVYVYSTGSSHLTYSPRGCDVSWDYCPAPVTHVGTLNFESDPLQPTKRYINSFVCADLLTYRFSIGADYSQPGSVEFDQTDCAGLRMTYNC